ncbi:MAG: DUF1232 domain-containing protein [Roseivirga sp.]|nr:DUF1232 domain-containing protein [Roseivirga sp.]
MSAEREPSDKEMRVLGKMKSRAKKIVNDHEELKNLLTKTKKKLEDAQEDDSLMKKMGDYIKLIMRMITGYLNGSYNDTPWQTIVLLVAGLLYFITPIDAIPDFIPIAGLIDDATVLVWLGKCFRDDLARFKNWENVNDSEE